MSTTSTIFLNHHQVQGHAQIRNLAPNATTIAFLDSRDSTDDKSSADSFTLSINPAIPNVKKVQILQVSMPVSFFPTQDQVLRWSWTNVTNSAGNNKWYALTLNGNFTTQDKLNQLAKDMEEDAIAQGATSMSTGTENNTSIHITLDLNQKFTIYTNEPFFFRPLQGDPAVASQVQWSIGVQPSNYEEIWDRSLRPAGRDDKIIEAMSTSHFGFPHIYNPMVGDAEDAGSRILEPDTEPDGRKFRYRYTAPYVATLQPNQYINLFSNISLNTSFSDKNRSGNIIAQIPVTDFGTTPVLNQQNFFPVQVDEALVQSLDFNFQFYDGRPPNFDPNQNVGIVMKFWYNDPNKSQTSQYIGERNTHLA